MILVNSVQLRIVYTLWFRFEQSCINVMWTANQNESQNQWRSFQKTVKLRIPKYKKTTVALLSTLRIICEILQATSMMVHPTLLSASNSGSWRNHLDWAGLAFPIAPKHPEWLHLGCKNKDVPIQPISPLWSYHSCSYLIPFCLPSQWQPKSEYH